MPEPRADDHGGPGCLGLIALLGVAVVLSPIGVSLFAALLSGWVFEQTEDAILCYPVAILVIFVALWFAATPRPKEGDGED